MSAPDAKHGTLANGRYLLVDELGQGGMATVFSAWDTRLEVTRAVKILKAHLIGAGSIQERFEREARFMARLHHPHIVTVHDVGIEGDEPYIIMELVDGGSLAGLVDRHRRIDPRSALRYVNQVLEALQFAHEEGIVHRDIKPANVLIDRRDRAKVTDFGIAQLGDADGSLTKTGAVLGTIAYMSPEVKRDGKSASPCSDLYAVGAMLFNCITGRNPLDLLAPDAASIHLEGLRPPIPALIQRATAYHPADRYQTAAEMAAHVELALSMLDPATRPPDMPLGDEPHDPTLELPAPPPTETHFGLIGDPLDESQEPVPSESPAANATLAPPTPELDDADEEMAAGVDAQGEDDQPETPAPLPTGKLVGETGVWEPPRRRGRAWAFLLGAAAVLGIGAGLWGWARTPAEPSATAPDDQAEVTTTTSDPIQPAPAPDPIIAAPEAESLPTEPPLQPSESQPLSEGAHPRAPFVSSPVPQATAGPPQGSAVPSTTTEPAEAEPEPIEAEPPVPVAEFEPPAPAAEVHIRLSSKPLNAIVRVAGRDVLTPGEVTLLEGTHRFEAKLGDWTTSCEQSIQSNTRQVHFLEGKDGCTLY